MNSNIQTMRFGDWTAGRVDLVDRDSDLDDIDEPDIDPEDAPEV